jgi:hypothetical protein
MMRQFMGAVFKRCEPEGYVRLSAFEHSEEVRPKIEWVPFDSVAVDKAAAMATKTAARRSPPEVFCPPPCIFTGQLVDGWRRGREQDILCCPVIAVELDERPTETRAALQEVLGPSTLVIESGGTWIGPNGPEPKAHLYWRLTKPAVGVRRYLN